MRRERAGGNGAQVLFGADNMKDKSESTHESDGSQCVHHWFIDERNLGVCKKCGESKQFSNSWSAMSLQKSWSSRSGKSRNNAPGPES